MAETDATATARMIESLLENGYQLALSGRIAKSGEPLSHVSIVARNEYDRSTYVSEGRSLTSAIGKLHSTLIK